MPGAETAFWVLCALVVYVYGGYPLLVRLLAATRRPRAGAAPAELPRVTLVFCVHNERPSLQAKIDNCLALDYPRDRLEILAGSDGSTDGSAEFLADLQARGVVKAHVAPLRSGKTLLLNRVVETATGEILLMTDASTLLRPDAVRRHVRHYGDSDVGCVGGDLLFVNAARGGVSAGHGLYWRYESGIRRAESALGILAYVSGAHYSIRRSLWKPVAGEFADDCISPLNVVASGHRVLYDPEAVAEEVASESQRGLFARRVRMVTRDLDATLCHARLMNPLRARGVAFSLLSHKLLRWLVSATLPVILLLSLLLVRHPLYAVLLVLQVAFYALAAFAALRGGRSRSLFLSIPLYFCVSNLGVLRGLVNVALGRRIGVWQPVGSR